MAKSYRVEIGRRVVPVIYHDAKEAISDAQSLIKKKVYDACEIAVIAIDDDGRVTCEWAPKVS